MQIYSVNWAIDILEYNLCEDELGNATGSICVQLCPTTSEHEQMVIYRLDVDGKLDAELYSEVYRVRDDENEFYQEGREWAVSKFLEAWLEEDTNRVPF
jgi:hypothetical protein